MIGPMKGAGGWVVFLRGDGSVVRVRFAMRDDGRLEPAEVHLEGAPRLTGDTLRGIPLGQMEAWANGPDREDLIERIKAGARVGLATKRWLTTIGGGRREPLAPLDPDLLKRVRRQVLRLRIPDGPRRPDSFYEKVGELYSALAASGSRRPAQEIAEANEGVEVSTVHRWIKEARRRGLLGSGRRGKAG